jgi:hypothetical protein
VVADEEYGRAGHFLDELETLEQRYVGFDRGMM